MAGLELPQRYDFVESFIWIGILRAISEKNLSNCVGAADVNSFLNAVGVTPDEKTVELICNSLKGKPIHEAINEGLAKVSTLSLGGGSGSGNAGGAKTGGAAPVEEAKKQESEEEANVSMGGLFSD